jgi:uncharacterized repeat protein (TIGR01451 family)
MIAAGRNRNTIMKSALATLFALLASTAFALGAPSAALAATSDAAITKTDGQATDSPGTSITYTIVVTCTGGSPITVRVQDNFPNTLSGETWTCTASGGSTCSASGSGTINDTGQTCAPGGTATYTVNANISPTATGTLSNTATVTATSGDTDSNTGNNSATDNTTMLVVTDPSITKTDGQVTDIPGTSIGYTIEVTNGGPSAENAAQVVDNFPASLTSVSWTCTAMGDANCNGGGGTGNINRTVSLGTSGKVTFNVLAVIDPCATGTLTNTATVSSPTDSNAGNNTATDNTTLTPQANLSITKTDSQTSDVPGTTIGYTIVATNLGPSCAPSATVTDTFPASLSGVTWTCSDSGAGSCGAAGGSGNINEAISFGSGGSVTYNVVATIDPATTGTLSNTASVAAGGGVADPTPGNNSATDNTTMTPQSNLSATKTDGQTTAVPGTPTSYVITVTSSGPSNEPAATIVDNFPAALNNVTWTCSASGTAVCPTASGSGNINQVANLGNSGTLTYNVDADIDDCSTGNLGNTVTVTSSGGVSDPTPSNNSATDNTTLTPIADLSITKVDDIDPILICNRFNYTVTVTNNGPSCATGVTVIDNLQPEMTFLSTTPANPTCNIFGQTATCNLGTMTAGAVQVVNLEVLATDWYAKGENTFNNVSVTALVTDPEPANDDATQITMISHSEPYRLTLTAEPRFMRIGLLESREFLMKLHSHCDPIVTTTNAVIDLTIDDRENIVGTIPSPNFQAGNNLTYVVPAIGGQETVQFVLYTNLVQGTEANNDMRSFADVIDDFINVADAEWVGGLRGRATPSLDEELSLILTAPRTVLAGETLHMTVSSGNASRLAASDVIITVQGPSSFALAAADPLPQSTVVLGDRVNYDWLVGLVSGPGNTNGTLDFAVPANTPDGTVLRFNGTVNDAIGRTDTDSRAVTVRQPGDPGDDVVLFIDHTAPTTVLVGGELHTTLAVDNAGRSDANDVEVSLEGPSSLTFVAATPPPASVDTVGGRTLIRWNIGTVSGPGMERISIVHAVPGSADIGDELLFNSAASDTLGNTAEDEATVTVRD